MKEGLRGDWMEEGCKEREREIGWKGEGDWMEGRGGGLRWEGEKEGRVGRRGEGCWNGK